MSVQDASLLGYDGAREHLRARAAGENPPGPAPPYSGLRTWLRRVLRH
ncbi:hypothetical protein [Streptomyces cylindrosporus]|uniref:Uncharacterized protein n=1 Tax=Streptomyces cylindrosporus TaxID=2927583 RepID=A0ABS9YNB8_9ACTN|nr:hypothetical protein [Streptomyces cylindrosporus]MCI3278081.1 hypothetical protein [Streptomyces cylindrosporus]